MLSLYLAVPLDPAGLRGLAAEAAELMASAVGLAGGSQEDGARVGQADREAVLDALAAHERDWGGHTVAFFACRDHARRRHRPGPKGPGCQARRSRPQVTATEVRYVSAFSAVSLEASTEVGRHDTGVDG